MTKFFKRMFYLFNINRCENCLSKNLGIEIVDFINHMPCEEKLYCKECNTEINYWAYGNWEIPHGENFWDRLNILDHMISENWI